MKHILLGIDIGTSAVKVAAFDCGGTVLASASAGYPIFYPHDGWAEQNPESWWRSTCQALRTLWENAPFAPEDVAAVGIAGQSWSAVAVDAAGNVLCPTPIWMDTRCADLCRELRRTVGEERIFAVAKNPLSPSYTTAKILEYRRRDPILFEKIHKILGSNGYIGFRLTGAMTHDLSQGYGLHCFDMARGTWDEGLAEEFGIPTNLLPELVPCHAIIGTVTEEASAQCGLSVGTPVAAGGLDAACGTLGVGVIHPGETQEQGGQAGGMSICTDAPTGDPTLILSRHVIPDRFLLQGGTTGGSGVMRWLEREFGDPQRAKAKKAGKSTAQLLDELAEAVPPGSEGVVFLPYMSGERSPIWDPNAKGVFYGLDFRKTKGHMIRGALEGVAFSLRHNLETAYAAGATVRELRAMGGAANSRLWTQIKADVTGLPIMVPASDEATTLGAAILGGVGVGVYRDFDEAVSLTVKTRRVHEPNPANRAVYDENYGVYRAIYENLKEIMQSGGTR